MLEQIVAVCLQAKNAVDIQACKIAVDALGATAGPTGQGDLLPVIILAMILGLVVVWLWKRPRYGRQYHNAEFNLHSKMHR